MMPYLWANDIRFLRSGCLITVALAAQCAFAGDVQNASKLFQSPAPRYELSLNLKEFSVLNSAARLGVGKYGGTASFEVTLARDSNKDVVWKVTIRNPKLIEVMEYWMAEKTAELVNLLDFDNLDAASKSALQTVKCLSAKVAYARANPIWDSGKLTGPVSEENGAWFIQAKAGKYKVTGEKAEELKAFKGRTVIATGYIKVRDQIEITSFLEKRENTLELFVMSFCPFSTRAESSILRFLADYVGNPKPALEIHYLFYKRSKNGKTFFTALHGDKEMKENVVQMVIRDTHPDIFHEYLLARAGSDAPWEELASEIGMTDHMIELVNDTVEQDGDALIQSEYEYVTGKHQIYDGSPTYMWESERGADVRKLELFKGLQFDTQTCSED